MKISFVSREDMAGSLAHSNGPSHYFMLVLYNALVALTAGKLKGGAGGGGHPEVAGASVEDDVEALARGSQLDGAIVLGLMQRSKVFLCLLTRKYPNIVVNAHIHVVLQGLVRVRAPLLPLHPSAGNGGSGHLHFLCGDSQDIRAQWQH